MVDISVIIPVYNTENYIEQCLQSVIDSKGFDRCEVILVDDGSTDDSAEIAAAITGQYANMALHRFDNSGPSTARNRGAELARGRYLYFLDSDDWLEPDYLQELYRVIEEKQCDMVFAGFSRLSEQGGKEEALTERAVDGQKDAAPVVRDILNQTQVMAGTEYLNCRMDVGDWENRVWSMLFRREFWLRSRLAFDEEVFLYEDVLLINLALLYADRVCSVPVYGYWYRYRTDSLVQGGVKERDIWECLKVLQRFRALWTEMDEIQRKALGRVLFEHISMTLYYIGTVRPKEKKDYYSQIRQGDMMAILRGSITCKKEWMKYLIFRYGTGAYYWLVRKRERKIR